MSRKKNTLKDLDDFLKQQAATLVTPARLSDIETAPATKPVTPPPVPSAPAKEGIADSSTKAEHAVSPEKLLNDLRVLASREGHRFRDQFYDLIIQSVESQNQYSPEDKMLINTALYLKSGDRWREVIREYWRKKSST